MASRHQGTSIIASIGFGCAIALSATSVAAQIVPDDTLGDERSQIRDAIVRGQPADEISGGAIRGSNLFHSFREFNVGENQRVYFGNPDGIANILGRVTGSDVSDIMGTLGVNGGANLFLLNPNGILFGANARLDVAGSFVASAGDRFAFPDGSEFSATNPQAPPLLTMSIPIGLQTGTFTGNIANEGNLATGQNLTLAGNNLDLQGQLQAGSDLTLQAQDTLRVQDSAIAPVRFTANGQMLLQGNGAIDIFALNHPNSGLFAGGNLVLRSSSPIGGDAHYFAGGNFRIEQLNGQAGDLFSPYDPVVLAIGDVTLGNYTGASLHILAGGSVTIGSIRFTGVEAVGSTISPNNPNLAAYANTGLTDINGTEIIIQGDTQPTLDVRAGVNWADVLSDNQIIPGLGQVDVLNISNDRGTTANITTGTIDSEAQNAFVFLTNRYFPNPNITSGTISTGNINLQVAGTNDSNNLAGSVFVQSLSDIRTTNINTFVADGGFGRAGSITLLSDAGSIDTTRGRLTASTTSGLGGNIDLRAFGNITTGGIQSFIGEGGIGVSGNISLISINGSIDTRNPNATDAQNRTIDSSVDAGFAGSISLRASDDIFLGNISTAANEPNAVVQGQTFPSRAGNISLASDAGNIFLNNSRISSLTYGDGNNGGNITISANSLFLNQGEILADTQGAGAAGAVSIAADNSVSLTNSYISTGSTPSLFGGTAGTGSGGNIAIRADSVSLAGVEGGFSILQASTFGAGRSGDIGITTQTLNITDGSEVIAQTRGAGRAGNIFVRPLDDRSTASVTISGIAPSPLLADGNPGGFSSGLFSTTERGATGVGGTIDVRTGALRIEDGGVISARSRSTSSAGNVEVDVNTLNITGGGQILTAALSSGAAGNIRVNATGEVRISGIDPSFADRVVEVPRAVLARPGNTLTQAEAESIVDPVSAASGLQALSSFDGGLPGGNIRVNAGSIRLADGAEINSQGRTNTIDQGFNSIFLQADRGSVSIDDSRITTTNAGNGFAGDIIIGARDSVEVLNGAQVDSSGNFGRILIGESQATRSLYPNLRTPQNITINGAALQTGNVVRDLINNIETLRIFGRAGNISLNARDSIRITNSSSNSAFILSEAGSANRDGFATDGNITQNTRQAGNITLRAGNLIQLRGSLPTDPNQIRVETSTYTRGNAGAVFLQADRIEINNSSVLSTVEAGANATGGLISLRGRSLSLSNNAQLQTLVRSGGTGQAGNVVIDIDDVTLNNSRIFSNLDDRVTGTGGNIVISGRSLSLFNGSQLQTQVNQQGVGNAGNIVLNIRDAIAFDNSAIFSSLGLGASGEGGNILIGSSIINADGSLVENFEEIVPTDSLLVTNGGQLIASTAGIGNAGNILIFADTIRFDGENSDGLPSAVFNGVDPGGRGIGGNVGIFGAESVEVSNGALLTVSSFGFGQSRVQGRRQEQERTAGNLFIQAEALRLDDNGQIVGETGSGTGGNLTFDLDRYLLMRGASQISTTSGRFEASGNGGNIRFSSGEGFLIAEPSGNNDIYSNAFLDRGGRVEVNAEGILGLRFRSREDLIRLLGTDDPRELTPRNLPSSDITAVSQTSPDLNGEVAIEANTDDPTRGLAELPADLADASQLIVESCSADRVADGRLGEFTVTGRGGLPPNPIEPVGGDTVLTELASADAAAIDGSTPAVSREDAPLVEAQGWTIGANGEIALVAQAASVTPSAPATTSPECNAP